MNSNLFKKLFLHFSCTIFPSLFVSLYWNFEKLSIDGKMTNFEEVFFHYTSIVQLTVFFLEGVPYVFVPLCIFFRGYLSYKFVIRGINSSKFKTNLLLDVVVSVVSVFLGILILGLSNF